MKNFAQKTLLQIATLGLLVAANACADVTDALDGGAGGGGGDADFEALYETSTFQMCKDCHAPDAPGATEGTEATQDWSSSDAAFSSLKGNASGLIGNFAGCNGVPLVGATSNTSLLVAVLDPGVRASFSVSSHPNCRAAAIVDETLRVDPVPSSLLQELKRFIDMGGFR
jgi:hypothetical protein